MGDFGTRKVLFWGPYTGNVGTIRAQINSACVLKKLGQYDVILVRAHSEFVGYESELIDAGIRIIDLGLSRMFPGLEKSRLLARRPYMLICCIFGLLPLIGLLRKERPDVVIASLLTIPALTAMIVSRQKILRIVSIQGYPQFLGVDGSIAPLWKKTENSIRKFLWNLIFPFADLVLTMTDRTRRELISNTKLEATKVHVVENPVINDHVLSALTSHSPHRWFNGNEPVLLGVGRLTTQKGFDILINAISILKKRSQLVKCLILGEGEDRKMLEQMVRNLGLTENVSLLGHMLNPYPYMAHADLFILSSRWEDPGHAIIEAASLGLPIVTSDCPSGPSELVSNGAGGFIFRNGDSIHLADQVQNALANPDAKKTDLARENAKRFTHLEHFNSLKGLIDLDPRI